MPSSSDTEPVSDPGRDPTGAQSLFGGLVRNIQGTGVDTLGCMGQRFQLGHLVQPWVARISAEAHLEQHRPVRRAVQVVEYWDSHHLYSLPHNLTAELVDS